MLNQTLACLGQQDVIRIVKIQILSSCMLYPIIPGHTRIPGLFLMQNREQLRMLRCKAVTHLS